MSAYVPIRTLLVANRGEIAARIMRTARAMGIATVAVYSDADAESPHVAKADTAVRLPGTAPADTYLRSALILDAASRAGADAIHPGYGFLSESGDFARVVTGAGLIWVGPPASAIDAMGSKIGSKELMRAAGVPTLPSVTVDGDALPDIVAVEELGWPLMVKASAGGGGRGMRVVWGSSELTDAIVGARREAEAAFGDSTVFLERFLRDPRHIEVQVVADAYGDTVALFERECSIQRRHQKIIEEAPSPGVSPQLRTRLVEAAVTAARHVGYVNAGTVEFVVDSQGEPFFLEMNTRLQVEHPVTEAITGLDLVRLQLLIAGGAPMPAEVHAAATAGPRGHAIEVRLYAEDPARGWLPSTGVLHTFDLTASGPPGGPVRVDSGVASGNTISRHYDPMLAKVIARAPTRDEAAASLALTLARSRIHGPVTNRDLLVRVLRHPAFLAGNTDTGFLDRHGLDQLAAPLAGLDARRRHALVAALAGQARRRGRAGVQRTIPSGYRNNASALQTTTYDLADGDVDRQVVVGYRFDRFGQELYEVEIDGSTVEVEVLSVTSDHVRLNMGGLTRHYLVEQAGRTFYVDGADGSSTLVEQEDFPSEGDRLIEGSALAPMPGGVVRVAVAEGDTVTAGQPLVVLEAMKMEHSVNATSNGVVTSVSVAEGDQVETGRVLVVVDNTTDIADIADSTDTTDSKIGTEGRDGARPNSAADLVDTADTTTGTEPVGPS
jgi:propionyl-CoA carboxylase alpha chain